MLYRRAAHSIASCDLVRPHPLSPSRPQPAIAGCCRHRAAPGTGMVRTNATDASAVTDAAGAAIFSFLPSRSFAPRRSLRCTAPLSRVAHAWWTQRGAASSGMASSPRHRMNSACRRSHVACCMSAVKQESLKRALVPRARACCAVEAKVCIVAARPRFPTDGATRRFSCCWRCCCAQVELQQRRATGRPSLLPPRQGSVASPDSCSVSLCCVSVSLDNKHHARALH